MRTPQEDWEHMGKIAKYLFGSPANAFNPEEFFVMAVDKETEALRHFAASSAAFAREVSERRIFKPGTETYVISKPTDDCDGILIARIDEAGNVSVEIA